MKKKSTKISCQTCKNVPENYFMMNCIHKICIECVLNIYKQMKKKKNLKNKNEILCDYCEKKTLLQKETLKYFENLISKKNKKSFFKKPKKKSVLKKKSYLKKEAPKNKKIYSKSILHIKKKSLLKKFNSKSQIFKKPIFFERKSSNSTRIFRSSKFNHKDNISKFTSLKKKNKNDKKSELSSFYDIKSNSERNSQINIIKNSKFTSVRSSALIARKNFKKKKIKKKKKIVKINKLKFFNFNIFFNFKENIFSDKKNIIEDITLNKKLELKNNIELSDNNLDNKNDINFSNKNLRFKNNMDYVKKNFQIKNNMNFSNENIIDFKGDDFSELKKDINYLKSNINLFKGNLYFSEKINLEKNLDVIKNLDCIKDLKNKKMKKSFFDIKNFVEHHKNLEIEKNFKNESKIYKKLYIKNNSKKNNILKLIENDIVLKSKEILDEENNLSRFGIELKTDLNRKFDFILNNLLNKKHESEFYLEKMIKENKFFYKRLKNFLFSFKRNLLCYKIKKYSPKEKFENILNDYNLDLEKFGNEKEIMEEKKIRMEKNRNFLENIKEFFLEKVSDFFKPGNKYNENNTIKISKSNHEQKNDFWKMGSKINKKINFENLRIKKKRELKKEKLSTFQQRLSELKQNNFFK